MMFEKPAQKFLTNDLGGASEWMKQNLNQSEALPSIRSLRSMIRSFQSRLLHLIVKTFLESVSYKRKKGLYPQSDFEMERSGLE